MDVICINGSFTAEQLQFWSEHGVVHPVEGSLYTVIGHTKHTTGQISLYLQELDGNPLVPIKHPVLGVQMMRVGFCISRFTSLLGADLKLELSATKTEKL